LPRASDDEPGRGGHAGHRADVPHVAAVRRDDERRVRGERGDQPARNEEVRVHDIGARRPESAPSELEVAALAAGAPVEHRPLDGVAARLELRGQPLDEHAEVRVGRPGIHLGDEQDAHGRPDVYRFGPPCRRSRSRS
jgi:hypothetical protein